jgi:hypothetical protein
MPFGSTGHSPHSGEKGRRKLMPHRDAELFAKADRSRALIDAAVFLNEIVGPLGAPYHGRETWETRSVTSLVVLATVGCTLALVLFY